MNSKEVDIIENNNSAKSVDSTSKIVNSSSELSKKDISDKLKRKGDIVKNLRNLLNGVEDSKTFKKVKKLQNEWKEIGIVNSNKEKSIWTNYNALLDRFYNNRSIYFELKDLDSKKNLEIKSKLCEQAEKLTKSSDIRSTIYKLNKIHNEFKQTGPVPISEKVKIWERLKKASDQIYKNKKEFFTDIKKTLENNLSKKQNILEKIENYETSNFGKISDWSNETKKIILMKDEWEKIGAVPKKFSKTLTRNFWTIFKKFFSNKSKFFKKRDLLYSQNLKLKLELIQEVESIKDSDDWSKTTSKILAFQKEWKKIGKVPIKDKDKIYKKFKRPCDHFFERMRFQDKDLVKEYESNYNLKSDICKKIIELTKKNKFSTKKLLELQGDFNLIGSVSKVKVRMIQDLYNDSLSKINDKLSLMTKDEISTFNFNLDLNKILQSSHSKNKLNKKRLSLKNKISKIESEVKNLINNVDFLKSSVTANNLKKDYDKKILEANQEVNLLKSYLSLINK